MVCIPLFFHIFLYKVIHVIQQDASDVAASLGQAAGDAGFLCRRVQQSQDAFVHAEHDSSTGDGPEEMGRHASVEAEHALFLEDELEALDESGIFWPAVSHGCLS